jgi:outer membrane protein assembly factor BamA
MEGAPALDSDDLIRTAKLTPNTPITVEEIQAAFQRLADTGLFSDIRYSVDNNALVFKLTLAASAQSLPARYANFLWWQPTELESLIEARVPNFHGNLPLTGNLTDQVEAALVALVHDKGIEATVTTFESSDVPHGPVTAIALQITRPEIVLGNIRLQSALPALKSQVSEITRAVTGQDFDLLTTTGAIRQSVVDTYQNAGYLDIAVEIPTYTVPHKDPSDLIPERLLVDASTDIKPGELYRISHIDLPTTSAIARSELSHAAAIKAGDPASVSDLRLAQAEIANLGRNRGYLDASAQATSTPDHSSHMVADAVTLDLGDLYHLGTLDTSALTPQQRAAFSRSVHPAPGVVADMDLRLSIARALHDLNLSRTATLSIKLDRANHIANITIKTAAASPTP